MSNLFTLDQALKNNNAFFAFSEKQFDEKQKEGIKYVSLGAGLVCPKENARNLVAEINLSSRQKIQEELKNNTPHDIVWHELANHEAQISCSIEDTVEALQGYGFDRSFIKEVYDDYFLHCCRHDLF